MFGAVYSAVALDFSINAVVLGLNINKIAAIADCGGGKC